MRNEHGELTSYHDDHVDIEGFDFSAGNPLSFHELPDIIAQRTVRLRGLKEPEFKGALLIPKDPESGKVTGVVKQVTLGKFVGVQLSGTSHTGHAPIEGTEHTFIPGQIISAPVTETHRGVVVVADKLRTGLDVLDSIDGADRLVDIVRASRPTLDKLAVEARRRKIGRFFRA